MDFFQNMTSSNMHKFDCVSIFLCGLFLLLCGWRFPNHPPQTYQLIELNKANCLAYRPELIYKSYTYDESKRRIEGKYTSTHCTFSSSVECRDTLHSEVNRQVNQILDIVPYDVQIVYKLKNGTYGIITPIDSMFYAFQNQSQFLHKYSLFLKNQTACFDK
jgi:hypothetical protein